MATSGVNNFFYHGLMYGYGVDSERIRRAWLESVPGYRDQCL